MKITDPDIIKTGEKDLIDAVKDDLDLDAVKQVLEKKLKSTMLSAKGGEIIVHNNKIAFRLDFNLNLSGSLMFDREGNYISDPDDQSSEPSDIPSDDSIETIVVDTPEPDEVDLDEIDIQETLEEVRPDAPDDDIEENIQEENQKEILDDANELDDDESGQLESEIIDDLDIEEDLDINLLDGDLDEDLVLEDEIEDEPIGLEPTGLEPTLEETEFLENEPDMESDLGSDLEDEDTISDDEDIDDILKESREFWDQKKDS